MFCRALYGFIVEIEKPNNRKRHIYLFNQHLSVYTRRIAQKESILSFSYFFERYCSFLFIIDFNFKGKGEKRFQCKA